MKFPDYIKENYDEVVVSMDDKHIFYSLKRLESIRTGSVVHGSYLMHKVYKFDHEMNLIDEFENYGHYKILQYADNKNILFQPVIQTEDIVLILDN
ncbi:MAG: hypothetical protein KAI55_04730, partial [Candidatus Aenigmarchaeota archaeon]|nr:hypothetical protein [Candidatus Aenigmarchaeota archaeon]